MDRRKRRTQEAIFNAFTSLLEEKDYASISIQEVIDKADIGRSTFYTHFNTKEDLVCSLCKMLFEHIFESASCGQHTNAHSHENFMNENNAHSILCHIIHHLEENDHNILLLINCDSSGIFTNYFHSGLKELFEKEIQLKNTSMPADFIYNHLASTFIEMIKWWIRNGKIQSSEELEKYYISINSGLI